jgi:hypothetical protein
MTAKLIATHQDLRREVWAQFDPTAEVWELFASKECDDYLGCADTLTEAKAVAREWFEDLMSR